MAPTTPELIDRLRQRQRELREERVRNQREAFQVAGALQALGAKPLGRKPTKAGKRRTTVKS